MKNILLVCTGNTCRSSMAEVILKDILEKAGHDTKGIRIESAGISAVSNQPASSQAIKAMKDEGIDLTKHKSKPITRKMIDKADLILTMTVNHKNAILQFSPESKDKVFTLKEYYLDDSIDIDKTLDKLNGLYRSLNEKRNRLLNERKNEIEVLRRKREEMLSEIKRIDREIREWEMDLEAELEEEKAAIIRLENSIPDFDVNDPFGLPVEEYKKSAKEIREALQKVVEKLIESQKK